jgi:DnaJ-class molecular chaperone
LVGGNHPEEARMVNKVCPECDGNTMIAPPGADEPIDCPTCDGDGWIVVEEDEEDE